MILLDTNVVSEMMRVAPAPNVVRWMNRFPGMQGLSLCSITVQEIEYGVQKLVAGRRRQQLEFAWRDTLNVFAGVIASFDDHAALCSAELTARAERMGRPILGAMRRSQGCACPGDGGWPPETARISRWSTDSESLIPSPAPPEVSVHQGSET